MDLNQTRKLLDAADTLLDEVSTFPSIRQHNRRIDHEKHLRTQIRNAARMVVLRMAQNTENVGSDYGNTELSLALDTMHKAGITDSDDRLRAAVRAAQAKHSKGKLR